jgi:hypothetical protein
MLRQVLSSRVKDALVDLATGAVRSAADFDALERGLTAIAGSSQAAQEQLVRLERWRSCQGLDSEKPYKVQSDSRRLV